MAEHQRRAERELLPSRLGLGVVLAAAAVLRFWELDEGLPHAIPVEETDIPQRAFAMLQAGTLDPGSFETGPLPAYLQLAVSVVRFLFGAMAGEWRELSQVTSYAFFPLGRGLVAALGTATVLLVYLAARRWGPRQALVAAGILAVLPLHITYSQSILPDVLLTALVTLTLVLSLAAAERPSAGRLALAGAAAGLAGATLYSGILALVMPLAACWLSAAAGSRTRATLGILGAAGAAFLAASPYVFLDLPGFLDGFARSAAAMREAAALDTTGPLLYLSALGREFSGRLPWHAAPALAVPALAMLMLGFLVGLTRTMGRRHAFWGILLAFVVVQVAAIVSFGPAESRRLLPLGAPLCILVTAGLHWSVSLLSGRGGVRGVRRAVAAGLTAAILLPMALSSADAARVRSQPSTLDLTYAWICENLDPDDVVAVEANALTIPRGVVAGRGIPELRLKTREQFAEEGVEFLVATSAAYGRYLSAPAVHRSEYRDYMRLFSETAELARFSPGPGNRGPELRVLKVLP